MGHQNEDGPIGQVSQPLVGGTLVDVTRQEEFGLLDLGNCSASLLRNDWAITAAHCLEAPGPVPDPERPGQNMLRPLANIRVRANWGGGQTRAAVQIITFRPYDIALIQTDAPFTVNGADYGYSRGVWRGAMEGTAVVTFGRGISRFAQPAMGANPATPSQRDGLYREGRGVINQEAATLVWFPSADGQMIAGGDSGGPSFVPVLGGHVLLGVHALANMDCLPGAPVLPGSGGQTCGDWRGPGPAPAGYSPWDWVAATPSAADAPARDVWEQITELIGPPTVFQGVFAITPANYHPIWMYVVRADGILDWYRKDTPTSPWQGPSSVNQGWDAFQDVIPAGGYGMYALGWDASLKLYRHSGFNTGARDWAEPVHVGRGWTFHKIFSGAKGVVYAIRSDGALLWYRHGGYLNGLGMDSWAEPTVIGSGWANFKDVFSTGDGLIYAVKPDGTLLLYVHRGWATGTVNWSEPRAVGTGWQNFRKIVPVGPSEPAADFLTQAGGGTILAVTQDNAVLWYRHRENVRVTVSNSPLAASRLDERWDGPVEQHGLVLPAFRTVLALLPGESSPVR